nr:hypothetical protein [uncultured Flavobacterium sp.]
MFQSSDNPIVNNTLGGTSNHEYQYDDFYRLKSAKTSYQGEFTKAQLRTEYGL